MKIVYCTDIHDGLKELRILLQKTEADLYLLSGDILYKAFYDDDKIYQFVCLQEEFYSLAKKRKTKIYPFDLAQDILRFPEKYEASEDWMLKAAEYRLLFNKASKTMKEKYELIEDIITKYGHAEARMLPGNYDIDLRYTALEHRDMHQKQMKFRGLKFGGYGGAPIATSGIPEKLAVVFHESNEEGRLYSEPENYFSETEPDVLVIHNPAYGYFDRVPGVGHVGSLGIRNYLDNHAPRLVVSGHVHEDYGICLRGETVLLNTSNFGGVDSTYGWQAGGAFGEIELKDDGTVTSLLLRRLVDGKIHDLMEVKREDGKLVRRKLDGAEHSNLNLGEFVRDASGSPVDD